MPDSLSHNKTFGARPQPGQQLPHPGQQVTGRPGRQQRRHDEPGKCGHHRQYRRIGQHILRDDPAREPQIALHDLPALYVVRSAGSAGAYYGRSTATLARSPDAENVHPTRCAITDAGICGNCASLSRIAGSNASTLDRPGHAHTAGAYLQPGRPHRVPGQPRPAGYRLDPQSSNLITPSL